MLEYHGIELQGFDAARRRLGLHCAGVGAHAHADALALGRVQALAEGRQPCVEQLGLGLACIGFFGKESHVDVVARLTPDLREGLEEPVSSIIDAVKSTLDKTPPELAADVMEKGIMLAGGGALLNGFPQRLAHETGMPVRVAENPLFAVALGSGQSLEEFEALKGVLFSSNRL